MMMRAGLGVGLDGHGAGPQFLRAGAGEVDRGLAVHAGRRGHVGIELVAGNDANAVVLPALRVVVIMGVIVDDRNGNDRGSLSFCFFPKILPANGTEIRDRKPAENRNFCASGNCLGETQTKEHSMGSTADKVKGATNEAIGKAKQGVGEAVGSDRLQGEGAVQEIKGKGQKAVGEAKQATKDAVNKAAAAANKNL